MLVLLIFVTLVREAVSGISDLNCTSYQENAIKYTDKAVICGNNLPNAYCDAVFGMNVKAAVDAERDVKCFQSDGKYHEEVKQWAIKVCPKNCGYCCLTDAYNCQNKPFPRILCSVVTQPMCVNQYWRPIIAEDCPNICGLCDASKCRDIAPYCAQHILICRNADLQAFARENCRRTCGFCVDDTGTTPDCGNHRQCPIWIRNNFCNNNFYTIAQRRKYCGRPCRLC